MAGFKEATLCNSTPVALRGKKTTARDRTCVVSDWAWPYVERLLRTVPQDGDALLFPGIDRWRASDVHR